MLGRMVVRSMVKGAAQNNAAAERDQARAKAAADRKAKCAATYEANKAKGAATGLMVYFVLAVVIGLLIAGCHH
jgi:F0F1-type ATP synthase assembly protein I